jgi:alpha/beta superfamily hydrolase
LSYTPALNLDTASLRQVGSNVVARRQAHQPVGSSAADAAFEGLGGDLHAWSQPAHHPACHARHAFFGPEEAPLFGCYHPPDPAAPVRSLAVLVCGAQGAEELSSHRSVCALAQGLAADGVPVLRFDWAGEGDSAGAQDADTVGGGRVGGWQASIDHALHALRQASGCVRIAIVGVQLGALLSAQILRRHQDIVAWLAVAPAPSGKQFLRERLALGHLGQPAHSGTAPGGNVGASDAQPLLEAGGFVYTQATREALGALTLEPAGQAAQAVGMALIVFQRDDLPLPARARAALGQRCEWHDARGCAQMVDEPHRSVVPQALIAALRSRLGVLAAASPPPAEGPRGAFGRVQACWAGVMEEAVHLDIGAGTTGLFGLLSVPAHGRVHRTVLMLNAGAIRHVGPSGLYTHLARRWAAQGVAVLRIDLSGLGESPAQPGELDNVVYGMAAVSEVAGAARWLARRTGVAQTQLLGLCAGAYHALQATMAGAPVERVLALNPLTFSHPAAQPFTTDPDDHVLSAVGQAVGRVMRHGWRGTGLWRRLLCGQLPVGRVLRRVLAYGRWRVAVQARRAEFAVARWLGRPRSGDLLAQLQGMAARGVPVDFVFSQGEPGPALLAQQTGASVSALQSRALLTMHSIEQADHIFSTQLGRCRLERVLDALVLSAPQRSEPGH